MVTTSATAKRPVEASSSDGRPKKRACYDYDKTITILVGPKEHRFVAHQDALCVKSKFFQVACSERWREGQEEVIRLPEVHSTETFQAYMDWTYTNELVLDEAATPSSVGENEVKSKLIDMYLLGDFLNDAKFQNEALKTLNTYALEAPLGFASDHYSFIWDNTPQDSLLRAWAADYLVSTLTVRSLREHGADYPADLVLRVAVQAMGQVTSQNADTKGLKQRLVNYLVPEPDA